MEDISLIISNLVSNKSIHLSIQGPAGCGKHYMLTEALKTQKIPYLELDGEDYVSSPYSFYTKLSEKRDGVFIITQPQHANAQFINTIKSLMDSMIVKLVSPTMVFEFNFTGRIILLSNYEIDRSIQCRSYFIKID